MDLLLELTTEITVEFKDKIFDMKMQCDEVDKEALKRISYLTNMPVYRQYGVVKGYLTDFIIQVFEKGKEFSIVNLN